MNSVVFGIRINFLLLSFVLICPLTAKQLDRDSLLADLPEAARAVLESDSIAFRYDRSGIGLKLAPDHHSIDVIKQSNMKLQPDVMVEGLYLIPYPQGTSDIDLNLYNITRRVSRISDVVYPSARKNAIVPLFKDVYRIESLQNRKSQNDPIVEEIPLFDSILIYMKEVVLGSGYYEAQYVYDGENLSFSVRNVTTLRALIKIVDTNNLSINIVLLPTDRGYLVYGYCGVKLANKNFVFRLMDPFSSFYKRLYSMVIWMENSLLGTDKQPILGNELAF